MNGVGGKLLKNREVTENGKNETAQESCTVSFQSYEGVGQQAGSMSPEVAVETAQVTLGMPGAKHDGF